MEIGLTPFPRCFPNVLRSTPLSTASCMHTRLAYCKLTIAQEVAVSPTNHHPIGHLDQRVAVAFLRGWVCRSLMSRRQRLALANLRANMTLKVTVSMVGLR